MSAGPSLSIQVDPSNPGQVLACMGLFDILGAERPAALGAFRPSASDRERSTFDLILEGPPAFEKWIELLRGLTVEALPHPEPAMAPVRLGGAIAPRVLDWWLDPTWTGKSPLKTWAGQVTSLQLFRDMLSAIGGAHTGGSSFLRVLDIPWPMRSTFGIDPRASWMALDVGYSPNETRQPVQGFPFTELLGAVGLQTFSFGQVDRRAYRYTLWERPLPAMIARPTFAGVSLGPGGTPYEFRVRERGSYKVLERSTPLGTP